MKTRIFFCIYFCIICLTIHAQSSNALISETESFVLIFEEPSSATQLVAEYLVDSRIIEDIVADMETIFLLPAKLTIRFASGLVEGPQYFQGVIDIPYEFLLDCESVLTSGNYTDQSEDMIAAVLGVTEFVLYHEVGHALIDLLDLPVLGKEEDAVDGFAAVVSSALELSEIALITADWFDLMSQSKEMEISDEEFWDSHSLDEQRMFTIFCLIYGSDPQQHSTLLNDVGMPAEKGESCQYDYQETLRNWSRVLDGVLKD